MDIGHILLALSLTLMQYWLYWMFKIASSPMAHHPDSWHHHSSDDWRDYQW